MTRTVLGELLHRLPISYGGEVGALGAAKIVELFERELEDLILNEKAQIMRAFEDGRRLGEVCSSEAYYTLKYERR
jgi:hypothetical protein